MYRFTVFGGNNGELIRSALLARGLEEVEPASMDIRHVHFVWKPTNLSTRVYNTLEEYLKIYPQRTVALNHCENNRIITTKTGLLRCLKSYYLGSEGASKAGYSVFDSTPTSFILNAGIEDRQYYDFVKRFSDIEKGHYGKERIPGKHLVSNLWLMKPSNLNQGRGIEVFRTMRELGSLLQSKPSGTQWVVQKYLERPLLYQGRKFDIRVWVVLTQSRQVYVFNKPYIRTSSAAYSTDKTDSEVHLTNNCLQKHCQNYSKYEPGNTLPLSALEQELARQPRYEGFRTEMVMERMRDLVIDTILAAKGLHHSARKVEFQLFGYDFMVDEDLRTWLIEVNVNPYLGVPNDYIKELLPRMVDQMLVLVADPFFSSKPRRPTPDFDLVYSEELNLRAPFSASLYPLESLAQSLNRKSEEEPRRFKDTRPLDEVIQSIIDTYPFLDLDPFHQPVARLVAKLQNFKSLSEKDTLVATKAVNLTLRSRAASLLFDDRNQQTLMRLLDPIESSPQLIQGLIGGIFFSLKDTYIKKKLNAKILVKRLAPLVAKYLQCPEEKEMGESVVRLLLLACGEFNRARYIPGETRELEQMRQGFISGGGLVLLLTVQKFAKDSGVVAQVRSFLDRLELVDWECYLRSEVIPEVNDLETRLSFCSKELCDKRFRYLEELQQRTRELERQRQERKEEEKLRQEQEKQKRGLQKKQILEEYIKKKRLEKLRLLQNVKSQLQQKQGTGARLDRPDKIRLRLEQGTESVGEEEARWRADRELKDLRSLEREKQFQNFRREVGERRKEAPRKQECVGEMNKNYLLRLRPRRTGKTQEGNQQCEEEEA